MYWIWLIGAGFFETGFAICLGKARETQGSAQLLWWSGFGLCIVMSMILLFKATKGLPMGTAYAVWTGIGSVGTVLLGLWIFREPMNFWRMFFLGTLIASLIGLKLSSPA